MDYVDLYQCAYSFLFSPLPSLLTHASSDRPSLRLRHAIEETVRTFVISFYVQDADENWFGLDVGNGNKYYRNERNRGGFCG